MIHVRWESYDTPEPPAVTAGMVEAGARVALERLGWPITDALADVYRAMWMAAWIEGDTSGE